MRLGRVQILIFISFSSFIAVSSNFFANEINVTLCSITSENFLIVKTADGKVENISTKDTENSAYNFIIFDLECEDNRGVRKLKPNVYNDDDWEFSNGSINIIDGTSLNYLEYCFDLDKNESRDEFTDVKVCQNVYDTSFTFYSIAMLVSIPCLIFTFFVYAYFPDLRSLHGKSVMFYVLGLTLLYSGLTAAQIGSQMDFYDHGDFSCVFVGYVTYFGVLISFFWLNIMCIDIWIRFRSPIKTVESERKLFLSYCVYAFGLPLIISFLVFLVDSSNFINEEFKPEIGVGYCFIKDEKLVQAIYIYIPVSIIIIFNTTLYSVTAINIFRLKKESRVFKRNDSQKHSKLKQKDKAKFFLYIRLFIIMGAIWINEPISWLFDLSRENWFFTMLDIISCLQGVIILVLFIWTPKVVKLFNQWYRKVRNLPELTTSHETNESTKTSNVSFRKLEARNKTSVKIEF